MVKVLRSIPRSSEVTIGLDDTQPLVKLHISATCYNGPDHLRLVPPEILVRICSFLTPASQVCLALTSHTYQDLVTSIVQKSLKNICVPTTALLERRKLVPWAIRDHVCSEADENGDGLEDMEELMISLRPWMSWTYIRCQFESKYYLRYGRHASRSCKLCQNMALTDEKWQKEQIERRQACLRQEAFFVGKEKKLEKAMENMIAFQNKQKLKSMRWRVHWHGYKRGPRWRYPDFAPMS